MSPQEIATWLLGAFTLVLGWLGRTLWDAQQKMRADHTDLALSLPQVYVRRDDYQRSQDTVIEYLRRIEDKLDDKVDKP